MKYAYTIWNETHYKKIDSVIKSTRDIVDYYIITTMPGLERDDIPLLKSDGVHDSYLGSWMNKDLFLSVIDKCASSGKELVLQIIPTPMDSRGKEPYWWQGWVWYDDDNDWNSFFNEFITIVHSTINLSPNVFSKYLIGAELISTLHKKHLWDATLSYLGDNCDCGYSHHFAHPLKHHYNWVLSLMVLFGYMFRGEKIYSDILSRLLTEPFHVPDDQKVQVGKNLYHAPMYNEYAEFVKLNDYFWYVMDKEYTVAQLKNRWEKVKEGGITIEFLPAVRSWLKKYGKDKEIWIENDLSIGYTSCTDSYYSMWWYVFLNKHKDLADVIVCWDNGDYERWAKAILNYMLDLFPLVRPN